MWWDVEFATRFLAYVSSVPPSYSRSLTICIELAACQALNARSRATGTEFLETVSPWLFLCASSLNVCIVAVSQPDDLLGMFDSSPSPTVPPPQQPAPPPQAQAPARPMPRSPPLHAAGMGQMGGGGGGFGMGGHRPAVSLATMEHVLFLTLRVSCFNCCYSIRNSGNA